ncbi:uncharacterized protein PHALS_10573 [Plasmopara halstedii]|uniref:Uncharacterized protein n=1 Tax=Plasmopara halstedii TaxID=4781 RepID=A0A0P1AI46_PLAHL|nr:uncharacterized protein PHALS_10573 [Plasmopara halstedii]CEG40369.1 hypothetical protein PHALS_10573 [Plasmopara halstedii]|eukprot:XP_024576738.1 hypothetical protein PHALS_10573 [Plasmopara halstedii]
MKILDEDFLSRSVSRHLDREMYKALLIFLPVLIECDKFICMKYILSRTQISLSITDYVVIEDELNKPANHSAFGKISAELYTAVLSLDSLHQNHLLTQLSRIETSRLEQLLVNFVWWFWPQNVYSG